MNKAHGVCCVILGTALLIAALSLIFYNSKESEKGGMAAESVLAELKNNIPEPPDENTDFEIPDNDIFDEYETEVSEPAVEDATMMVDEYGYIGIVALPDLGIELPVMSEWSYPNLKISPCRYKGTVGGGDIIIAAHNYRSHFGTLQELSGGETVYLRTVDGVVHEYAVTEVVQISGTDIDAMEFGSAENWDLTLFTCTLGGQSRVTVRCSAVE